MQNTKQECQIEYLNPHAAAACALALAVTADPVAAARLGNLAASITIMKKGTGTASPEEILEVVNDQ